MKTRVLSVVFVCLAVAAATAAGPRDDAWRQVEEAAKQGLPKTALERIEPIVAGALRDRAYPEAIKAIARRVALEGEIQGNRP